MMHEHLHLFADGLRRLVHEHAHPVSDREPLANRKHRHANGEHSHPHGHAGYYLFPDSEERRPIIARAA